MNVECRTSGKYKDVTIEIESSKVSLGLLDEKQQHALACEFLNGIYELSPCSFSDWFKTVLDKCGIEYKGELE